MPSTTYAETDLFKGRIIEKEGLQLKAYTLEEYKKISLFEAECLACLKTVLLNKEKLSLLERRTRGLRGLISSFEDIVASQDDVLTETDLLLRHNQEEIESLLTDRDVYFYAMVGALAVLAADLSYHYLIK